MKKFPLLPTFLKDPIKIFLASLLKEKKPPKKAGNHIPNLIPLLSPSYFYYFHSAIPLPFNIYIVS
jgi:hypothetical protein